MKKGAIATALTAVCMVAVLAAFAGNVRATDEETTCDEETASDEETTCEEKTTYKFRLVNQHTRNWTAYIRCGSSGSWTSLAAGSIDKDCSESSAQTKLAHYVALDWSHNCPDGYPVKRIKYSGYWLGLKYKEQLTEACLDS